MTEPLRFIHITDTHIGPKPDYKLDHHVPFQQYHSLIQYLNDELPFKPAFVLHTGDVAYDPDPAAYDLIKQEFLKIKYKTYYVRGNHDSPEEMRRVLPGLPEVTGKIDYDFMVKDFHFIVLDTFGHVQPSGYLEAQQLAWLKSTCENSTAQSLVIVCHHLPTRTGFNWFDKHMIITNGDALFDVLEPFQEKIRCLLFGHVHRAFSINHRGVFCISASPVTSPLHAWPHASTFEPDACTPGGYNIVTLTHEGVCVTHHTFPLIENIE